TRASRISLSRRTNRNCAWIDRIRFPHAITVPLRNLPDGHRFFGRENRRDLGPPCSQAPPREGRFQYTWSPWSPRTSAAAGKADYPRRGGYPFMVHFPPRRFSPAVIRGHP